MGLILRGNTKKIFYVPIGLMGISIILEKEIRRRLDRENTLKKIDGMFAFGLWDQKSRCLSLARDRVREKPPYYGYQGEGNGKVFLFGSELKALKAHPEFKGEINRNVIGFDISHTRITELKNKFDRTMKF